MAVRKKAPKETAQEKREREQRESLERRCIWCEHAYLMQSRPNNPIVAMCDCHDGERNVARNYICNDKVNFKKRSGEPTIHPMIYLN